ncbi:MAG: hypothetical protein PHF35_02295 [Candidatus Moranbacteria bacterium]|nr:hypothetical protein [Candidatus Moranbacteria bacterium]
MDECARRGVKLCEISEEEYRNLPPLDKKSVIGVKSLSDQDLEFIASLAELLLS